MKKLVLCAILVAALAGISKAQIMPDDWNGERWLFLDQRCDPWVPDPERRKDPILNGVIGLEFDMISPDFDFAAVAFPFGFGWDFIPITIEANGNEDTVFTVNPLGPQDWYIFNPTVDHFEVYWNFPISIDTDNMLEFSWWLRFAPCTQDPEVDYSVTPIYVPEPATLSLLALGGLLLRKRK